MSWCWSGSSFSSASSKACQQCSSWGLWFLLQVAQAACRRRQVSPGSPSGLMSAGSLREFASWSVLRRRGTRLMQPRRSRSYYVARPREARQRFGKVAIGVDPGGDGLSCSCLHPCPLPHHWRYIVRESSFSSADDFVKATMLTHYLVRGVAISVPHGLDILSVEWKASLHGPCIFAPRSCAI